MNKYKITFTIRNKSKQPIVTYSKSTMELFMSNRPETVSMFLDFHKRAYNHLTGKTFVVDHEQRMFLLENLMKVDSNGFWKAFTSGMNSNLYLMNDIFNKGCYAVIATMDLDDLFFACSEYYEMLYKAHTESKE